MTRETVVDAGVKLANANQPSELSMCRMNGLVEDRRTYGDDPYSPRA